MDDRRTFRVVGTCLALFFLLSGAALPTAWDRSLALAAEPWAIEGPDAPRDFRELGERSLALDSAARPHIAYAGAQLYYAHYDGAAWQFTTVDSSLGASSGPLSLALDASDRPHIAYRGSNSLKYAYHDGSGWRVETVAAGGYRPSLALDAFNRPHIAYGTSTDSSQLCYAWHDGTSWHIEVVDGGKAPSLRLDPTGRPHISYEDSALKYAWHDGDGWHREVVDIAPGRSSLALGADSRPHIAYTAGTPSQVRHAWHDGMGWQIETVAPGEGPALTLDATGRLHLGYLDGLALQHAVYDGQEWQIETVATGDAYSEIAAGIDPLGNPNLVALAPGSGELLHAWHDGTSWQLEVVDRTGDAGRYSSLALDASGQPHISYCHYYRYDNPYPSQCDSLRYAFFDGSAWQVSTVDRGPGVGYDTALELDAANRPHITYRQGDALKYAYHNGTAWQLATVDGADIAGYGTSLALDAADQPHIAYSYSGALYALKYAWYSGGRWYTAIVETNATAYFRHASLALDAAGRPHISYGLYSDAAPETLKYAWYDGADWHIETVDSGEGVGGHTSLALDAAGRPRIGYSGGNSLKYAWHDGSAWHTRTVDGSGLYNSLVLDAAGQPHISSYDAGNYRLRYAWYDGAAWQVQTVDSDANVGMYSSLAMDEAGHPFISYYDAAHYDLRLAHRCIPLSGVEISGPSGLPVGASGLYAAWPIPGNTTPPIAYAWDNGSTGPTALYSWPEAGTYTVSVSATSLCGAAQEDNLVVVVTCQPVEELHVEGPSTLPTGREAAYQAVALPISPSLPLTITWNNGALGLTAAYSWTVPGTYTVSVTTTNPCGQAQAALTVTTFCQTVNRLQIEGPSTLPPGLAGTYQARVEPPTASLPLSFTWDNGTAGPMAVYSWPATGTYAIAVTATNDCGTARGTLSVTVACDPVRAVEVSGAATLTVGQAVTFTALVLPPTATLPITITWDNGSIGPAASYSWPITGVYTLSVTATNACGIGRGSWGVHVVSPPRFQRCLPMISKGAVPQPCEPPDGLAFSWVPLTPTVGQVLTLTARVSGTEPLSFAWDLGDGATAEGGLVTHTYASSGTFQVTLLVGNACGEALVTHTLPVLLPFGSIQGVERTRSRPLDFP